jgi:hypothetical protein
VIRAHKLNKLARFTFHFIELLLNAISNLLEQGYMKHVGPMFSSDVGLPVTAQPDFCRTSWRLWLVPQIQSIDLGLPITAQPDIAGPVGGLGWFLKIKSRFSDKNRH